MTRPHAVVARSAPFGATTALDALVEASKAVGLDARDAELVRLGSNAVFRFRHASVVGRVAPSEARFESARHEVAVARWLAEAGVPAVRALNVTQPLVVQHRVVTFWESASDAVEYGSTVELGLLLRQLHGLTSPLELPACDPIGRALNRLRNLDGEYVPFLVHRIEQLREPYSQLTFALPIGVIHGDANVGNVIRDRDGRAIFSDLESVSTGPREWDLVQTALFYERLGWHTLEEYRGLIDTYGFDIMSWSGYPVMRDLRELFMVAWLAEKTVSDTSLAAELAVRVRALQTGASRRDWRPL
jgi:aminoglycoside phosphotransferase (APT) family kinase protein